MKWAAAWAIVVASIFLLTRCDQRSDSSVDTLIVITIAGLPVDIDSAVMPNVDALATRGVRFENAYTTAPMRRAAVLSMFTGLDPLAHGARAPSMALKDDIELVPSVLQDDGYATGAFVGSEELAEASGVLAGFDVWTSPTTSRAGRVGSATTRLAKPVIDDTIEWFAETSDQAELFVWVHLEEQDLADVDTQLGRLFDALARERPSPEHTTSTIVTAHSGPGAHGLALDDDHVRVPLLLDASDRADRWPTAFTQPGESCDAYISLTDIAPTLLELAGFRRPEVNDCDVPTFSKSLDASIDDRPVTIETIRPKTWHGWQALRRVLPDGAPHWSAPPLTDPVDRSADIQRHLNASAALTRGRRLLRLEPDAAGAEHVAGESARERRARGLAALEDARASLDAMAPGSPWVARHIGLVELSRGNVAEAADAFEAASTLAPEHAATRHHLGGCYAQLGHSEWALDEMVKALQLDETFALAYEWIVAHHVRSGDGPSASWWLKRYADTFPARDDLYQRSAQLISAGSTPSSAPPAEAQRATQQRALSPTDWLIPARIRASSPSGQDR